MEISGRNASVNEHAITATKEPRAFTLAFLPAIYNMPAKLKQIAPQFVVLDVVKTAEFYRDFLGFNILGYFLDPPVYAMVGRDGVEIHFGKADSSEIKVNESVRKGLGSDAYIFVSDIEELQKEFLEKNVEIIEGPVRRVYGCTEITIKDCNGFQLVFGQ